MRDLALEVYFSRWRSVARHDLTSSDSETLGLAELLEMADAEDLRRWETVQLGYTDPRGSLWLRETVAGGYESAAASSVLCFAGAQEGIYAAMHALLGADDHAIVVTPNYQSTESVPLGLCTVTGVALDPARGWSLDIDAVAAAVRPNTRLVSINFPNNPTGKLLERDRFDALIALCRRHGIWLFSDEIYRLIERDPSTRLPAAVDAYERGLSLGCVSKSYGLPGLRVGWIACRDPGVLRRMERVKHYLSNCVAAPSELLARIALKAGGAILSRNRRIAERNLARLNGFFTENDDRFDWPLPDGGVVGYPRYKGADGVEAFCARLVVERGVLLLPASIYRSDVAPTPDDHFRIGFGHRAFSAGLEALKAGLRQEVFGTRRAG
ncbi:MAG TPA: pyridoxal phosphate-dependent aminotransferase [Stellaceae bacterium]|nr:pyridoxal phosphate-dependent aminotransferase [Stellaceae bacterium]